jgi:signal peptidase I
MPTSPVELSGRHFGSGDTPAPDALPGRDGSRSNPLVRIARVTTRAATLAFCAAAAVGALVVVALAVGPRFLPYRAYAIEGGSMEPTLAQGSEVILRPVAAADLSVGDIITFRAPTPDGKGKIVTHRIVRFDGRGPRRTIVTKGDANPVPDAWRIAPKGVGWRRSFSLPWVGYLIEALQLPIVRFAVIGAIVLSAATAALRKIWRPAAP